MIQRGLIICLVVLFGSGAMLADGKLERKLLAVLHKSGLRTKDVSMTVYDDRGRRVVNMNSELATKPASNLKLLVTLAGLEFLGADYVYKTRLHAIAPLRGGIIKGDVTLFGTGDPNISGRFYGDEPLALFERWGRELRASGLRTIDGDLLVDDRFFDDVHFLPGWPRDQEGRWYCAEISPLTLNDNCIDIRVTPTRPGRKALVSIVPRPKILKVTGAPMTVSSGDTKILIHRTIGTHRVKISGRIHVKKKNWIDHVTVHDPAMFFAHTLKESLGRSGVVITGEVRRVETPGANAAANAGGAAAAGLNSESPVAGPESRKLESRKLESRKPESRKPESRKPESRKLESRKPESRKDGGRPQRVPGKAGGAREKPVEWDLIEHTSALEIDLAVINQNSQNLHAEILLKTLGARVEKEGSVAGGGRVVAKLLERYGVRARGLVIADGSGLSHGNRVSSEMLARSLMEARDRPYFPVFVNSLAVSGQKGTLTKRFRSHPELKGKVAAKTGFISNVSGISGYVRKNSRVWCFSILFSRLPGGNVMMKKVQDRCISILYEAM